MWVYICITQNFSTCLFKNLELQIICEFFPYRENILGTWCLKLFRVEYTVLFRTWCFLDISTVLIWFCLVSLNINDFSQNDNFNTTSFILNKVKTESSRVLLYIQRWFYFVVARSLRHTNQHQIDQAFLQSLLIKPYTNLTENFFLIKLLIS